MQIHQKSSEGERQINKDICLEEKQSFTEAGLHLYLLKCFNKLNYNNPTPIQYYSLSTYTRQQPISILAQSKSGTGKTLSYLSILLTHLLSLKEIGRRCSYLILLPTRELALQVYQTFKEILNVVLQVKAEGEEDKKIKSKLLQVRSMMCIGGIPFQDDKRNYLANGGTVLIGTVGRLLEFVDKKLVKVSELQMVVLDEGDKLFENKNVKLSTFLENCLKFKKQMEQQIVFLVYSATFSLKLVKELTKRRDFTFIQTLAQGGSGLQVTITKDPNQLIKLNQSTTDQLNNISEVAINLDNIKKYKVTISDDTQSYFNAKIAALITLLGDLSFQRCLVFVEKKTLLEQINQRLIEANLDPLLIHGSLSQSSRIKLMNQINHAKIIIASDLLARGIDLELDLVILFDAKNNDTFWHRIGRTGRFGSDGVAISLDFIEDWQDYEKKQVQSKLGIIAKTFKKHKEWYGTYMTELGRWNETTQQKQLAESKQFKYFDETKFSKGRKLLKKDQVLSQSLSDSQQHHLHPNTQTLDLQSIQQIACKKDLDQLIKNILQCPKCLELMRSIEELTGYHFAIQEYSDSIR